MRRHKKRQPGRRKLKRSDASRKVLNRLIHMLPIVMGAVIHE